MTAPDWLAYITAAKSALDILKGIRAELPKGPQADKAQQQIEQAESALKLTNAKLAQTFDYKLCRCAFPPPIMLWRAADRLNICPKCGDRFPPPQSPEPEDEWITARR